MTKKSIQKLLKFLTPNSLKISRGILQRFILGILVASLFLPVFVFVNPRSSAAANCDIGIGYLSANSTGGSIAGDSPGITGSKVLVNKNTVALEEQFEVYLEVSMTPELTAECAAAGKTYQFEIVASESKLAGGAVYSGSAKKILPASLVKEANKFAAKVPVSFKGLGLTGKQTLTATTGVGTVPRGLPGYYIYGYFLTNVSGGNGWAMGSKAINSTPLTKLDNTSPSHPVTENLPNDVKVSPGIDVGTDGILYDAMKFRVGMDGAGLDADKSRNFFRITFKDGGWVAVAKSGATNGATPPKPSAYNNLNDIPGHQEFSLLKSMLLSPFAIQEAMAQGTTKPATSSSSPATSSSTSTSSSSTYDTNLVSLSSLKIPVWMSSEATGGIAWGDKKTKINYSTIGNAFGKFNGNHPIADLSLIAVEDKKSADKKICGPLTFNKQQIACYEKDVAKLVEGSPQNKLLTADKKQFPFNNISATELARIGVKDASGSTPTLSKVYLAPTLKVDWTWTDVASLGNGLFGPDGATNILSSFYGFSYTADAQKLYFEVYPSKEELEKHKNDAPPAGVEPYAETVTSSSTASSDSASDLFNFLRKVISYLVLLMTSVIYWIFAIILVPILNALLKIRPYEDQFVNFIYPGWIILRNVANIGFILALLWMGLRTLFQVDDAGKSRGFILWLVLMALLVNFSLVIAQGVVGIADTVQSQFLPAESKVIEALGQKLMVDPIKFFRGQDSSGGFAENITENSNFTVKASASDITKPIVLLILAIAAFFSFVALIAFILVRLVALWLLYMVSPLAYVARILPETKSYFDQWWSQFIKYAFTVPILAFFLNITALMATTFASRSGDAVEAGRNPSYLFAGMDPAKEITEYAITIISHFVVLVFLYAGMHFALKSGTFGAKQIVDGAKKGFDFVTKTVPAAAGRGALAAGKWAKDTGADYLTKPGGMLDGKPGWQKAVMSAARPIQALKAVKKGYLDNPKELMEGRFTKAFEKITKKVQPYGEDKLYPLKWAGYKITGKDSKAFLDQANKLKQMADIMDDTDKVALVNERGQITTQKASDSARLAAFQNNLMDTAEGRGLVDQFDPLISQKNAEIKSLQDDYNKDMQEHGGQVSNKGEALYKQIGERKAELSALEGSKNRFNTAVTAAEYAGSTGFNISGLRADIKPVFDVDEAEQSLIKSINQANRDLPEIQAKLDSDTALRSQFGMDPMMGMNPAERKEVMKKVEELTKEADLRSKPFSPALAADEAEQSREEQKKLVDLDYDQLKGGFQKALAANNIAAARAHLKQLADSGLMDNLLEDDEYKLKNNVEGLAELIKKSFPKATNREQITIIREISQSSAKNGNNSLAEAVKSMGNGSGMLNSIPAQQKTLEKRKVKSIFEMKKGDITYTDSQGNKQYNAGVEEKIKSMDTPEKAKLVKRDLDRKIADHILSKYESNPASAKASLGDHIGDALVTNASPAMQTKFRSIFPKMGD